MPKRFRDDAGFNVPSGGGGATPDLFYIVANPPQAGGDQIGKGQAIEAPLTPTVVDLAIGGFGFDTTSVVDIQPLGAPPVVPATLAGPPVITDPVGTTPGTITQQITVDPDSSGIYAVSVTNAAGQIGCVRLQISPQA